MNWEQLKKQVSEIAGAIASPNLSYCASIDMGDAFPAIIMLALSETDDNLLETLRFLAENGRFFPESMKEASKDEFRAYLKENEETIFSTIKEEAEAYYEEYTGYPYTPPCPPCPYCESTNTETTDEEGRITRFEEKPPHPTSTKASMGVYVFTWAVVDRLFLFEDGTIWFRIKGETEYRDIDTLSITDLEKTTKS